MENWLVDVRETKRRRGKKHTNIWVDTVHMDTALYAYNNCLGKNFYNRWMDEVNCYEILYIIKFHVPQYSNISDIVFLKKFMHNSNFDINSKSGSACTECIFLVAKDCIESISATNLFKNCFDHCSDADDDD